MLEGTIAAGTGITELVTKAVLAEGTAVSLDVEKLNPVDADGLKEETLEPKGRPWVGSSFADSVMTGLNPAKAPGCLGVPPLVENENP